MMVIYKILNKVNGHCYIGSAVNFKKRKVVHLSRLRRNIGKHNILQNAWNKYGEDKFEFLILEKINKIENLIPREQYYLDELKPEYNILKLAGSSLGARYKHKKRRTSQFKAVLQYDLKMNFIKEFESMAETSEELQIASKYISKCCNGLIHSTHNFKFRFRDFPYVLKLENYTEGKEYIISKAGKIVKTKNLIQFCKDYKILKVSTIETYFKKFKSDVIHVKGHTIEQVKKEI